MIRHVIHVCEERGVESSICGEAPSNSPEMVEFLVKAGISSISVNIDAIDKVRVQVNELEKS
jgi:pyruvate,water dikinase